MFEFVLVDHSCKMRLCFYQQLILFIFLRRGEVEKQQVLYQKQKGLKSKSDATASRVS